MSGTNPVNKQGTYKPCASCPMLHENPSYHMHRYSCGRDGTGIWWDPQSWGCDFHGCTTTKMPKRESTATIVARKW